jgi:hypothetical protein
MPKSLDFAGKLLPHDRYCYNIKGSQMSYSATISKITSLEAHPNADKIQLARVMGEQVVVGLDTKVDDIGIYFPVDGVLSHEFCLSQNLYSKSARKALGLAATQQLGFFDKNRRVRAQTFRGARSEGFWMPISDTMLAACGLTVGTSFTEINGIEICKKHETLATINSRNNQARSTKRGELPTFPKHFDTDQFRHKWEEIPEGSIIYLTEKLHGTSGRFGNVVDGSEPKWFEKILHKFGYANRRHSHIHGTRNVILGDSSGEGFYGSDEFRISSLNGVELHKGEVIYFELVGDVSANTSIMPSVKVDKKELPEIYKQYGSEIHYRYGAKIGETKLYVYRIVRFTEDGTPTELSWPQVKKRCKELDLRVVPEITDLNTRGEMFHTFIWNSYERDLNKGWIEQLSHGPSLLDPTHIREGVAIRIETPDGRIYSLKEKSFEFKFLEGIIKSNDAYSDIEEAA